MQLHFFSFESEQPPRGLGFIAVYEVIHNGMYSSQGLREGVISVFLMRRLGPSIYWLHPKILGIPGIPQKFEILVTTIKTHSHSVP